MTDHAALGEIRDWSISDLIGGIGYQQFVSPSGCHGLARTKKDKVEILAVAAGTEGQGQFRNFIESCKQDFHQIDVLEIWSPTVQQALERYGFTPFKKQVSGELISGMRWVSNEKQQEQTK